MPGSHLVLGLSRQVLDCLIGWHDEPMDKNVLTLIPQQSVGECWLPLFKFDYSKNAKAGCPGCKTFVLKHEHVIYQFWVSGLICNRHEEESYTVKHV